MTFCDLKTVWGFFFGMVVNNPLIRLRLFSWRRVWGWVEFISKFKIHKDCEIFMVSWRSLDSILKLNGKYGWSSILAILATEYVTFVTFHYQLGGSIQGCFTALCSSFFLRSFVGMPWQIVEGLEVTGMNSMKVGPSKSRQYYSCRRWWSSRSKSPGC